MEKEHLMESSVVKQIIDPQMVIEGAGVLLRRSFGPARSNFYDPFLLFDHFAFNDPLEGPIRGFPTHPHRGIETVTYMLEGSVRHRDSIGNTGIIGPGDVQWMTSGRGILHEEMPRRGAEGTVMGFQLWVNLPARLKMGQPRYQEVSEAQIPVYSAAGVHMRVVAGAYGGIRGPVGEIAAQPLYLDVALDPGAQFELPAESGRTTLAYLFQGGGQFNGQTIAAVKMLVLDADQVLRVQAGAEGMRFMLMSGVPFKEPIYPYGPFVMNTMQEIEETIRELRDGTFVTDSAI
jgi:redox-sensitive bicupin YhaK (pirin superfamily)